MCDDAKVQHEQFLDSIVKINKDSFRNFDKETMLLDQFLGAHLMNSKQYESLWLICKFVFTLSHGQSQIERGFNVNKDVLCVNMEKRSLKARRMVYDHMIASKVSVVDFVIKKELLQSCKASHSKYVACLKEKKDDEAAQSVSKKRKLLQEEACSVKRKKMELETIVTSLTTDIERYSVEAGEKEDLVEMKSLLTKANSFRDAVKSKTQTIKDLEIALKKIEEEIQAL